MIYLPSIDPNTSADVHYKLLVCQYQQDRAAAARIYAKRLKRIEDEFARQLSTLYDSTRKENKS